MNDDRNWNEIVEKNRQKRKEAEQAKATSLDNPEYCKKLLIHHNNTVKIIADMRLEAASLRSDWLVSTTESLINKFMAEKLEEYANILEKGLE